MMVHLNNQSFLFGNNKCWNITVTCLSSRYKRTLLKMKGSSVCRSQPRGSVSQEIQHKLFTQTDLWPAGPLWPTAHQPRCCNHDKASRLLFCLEENQTKQKKKRTFQLSRFCRDLFCTEPWPLESASRVTSASHGASSGQQVESEELWGGSGGSEGRGGSRGKIATNRRKTETTVTAGCPRRFISPFPACLSERRRPR